MAPTDLFIVRHGQTDLNVSNVLRGRIDVPLNEMGHSQAAALGIVFVGVRPAVLAASPLVRAQSTAFPIAVATGVTVQTAEGLTDRDFGPWSGIERRSVERQFGSVDDAPGVEDQAAFEKRVLQAIGSLVNDHPRGPVIACTHDAVAQVIVDRLPERGAAAGDAIANGSWTQLTRDNDGWRLVVAGALPSNGRKPVLS